MKISALIASLNENDKLEGCLNSLTDFADEIIVFDMSTEDDKLSKICSKYGARVVKIKPTPYVELIRNFMVDRAKGEWILMLDPDERLGNQLKGKLLSVITNDEADVVNIPRKNIIFGSWIKHTNWWPDRQIRFFKRGRVVWTKTIHLYPKVTGVVLNLPAKQEFAITHYTYDNIHDFLERQNRYSNYESKNLYDEGEKSSLNNLIWWPKRVFLARYIKHFGFLDGVKGFELVYLMMIYKLMVWVKLWENSHD